MALRSSRFVLPILLCACRASVSDVVGSARPPSLDAPPGAGPAASPDDVESAVAAVRRGDYRAARSILAGMIVTENVGDAERLVGGGQAVDALVLLDEALELAPRDADLLFRRAEAAYAAGDAMATGGGGNPEFFYRDALDHYLDSVRAGYGIEAAFQASRAARRIPDPQQALDLVRDSIALLEQRREAVPAIEPPVERIWAEAAFDVYLDRVRNEEDGAEYFAEAEVQLERLLGRNPTDAWPRMQLANLYQWAQQVDRAVLQVQMALEVAPEDQVLHNRLMDLMPGELGFPALVDFYTDFAAKNPTARSFRNLGVAGFYAALARFDEGEYDIAAFRAAEEQFRRARETDAAWDGDCRAYEAVARNAVGWCHYHAEENSAAKEAFFSMEDLFEGGLAWSLPGRLPDGITGLGFVVLRLTEDPNAVDNLDQMIEAAAITDFLHAYRPDDGNLANNAGFVNRDTAVLFERKSRIVRSEAKALEDPQARAQREQEADRMLARAQELMEGSWSAYQIAAALFPEDVRIVNDAGLVMAYYLRTDADAAERYFLDAVALGGPQLEDLKSDPTGVDEDELYNLNEAWGDAHQNMAILEMTMRRNPAKAKEWLLRSLEIGPPSREEVRWLLDILDRMIAGEKVDLVAEGLDRMVWLKTPKR